MSVNSIRLFQISQIIMGLHIALESAMAEQFGLSLSSEDSKTKASFVVSVALLGDLRISSVTRRVYYEAIELFKLLFNNLTLLVTGIYLSIDNYIYKIIIELV